MKILVDADACPVIPIIETIAQKNDIPVILLCDTNHIITSDYSECRVIGAGADAVDFAVLNACNKGDIVVTQDYGLAAMILGKGALGIHQSGKWYTNDNIDQMLMERHINKQARRAKSKHHLKGPRKRSQEDDQHFAESFQKLLIHAMELQNKNTSSNSLDRVIYMSGLYNQIYQTLESQDNVLEKLNGLDKEVNELEKYYMGPDWIDDFEAERRGEFPTDMDRGILTEDAIYDLLTEIDGIRDM